MAYIIHPTTLDKLACRLQYHWSRNYKPIRSAPALEFGIAIHHALEIHYGQGLDPIKEFRAYVGKNFASTGLGEPERELGSAMLANYVNQYRRENFTVISTEQEIARRVPVAKDDPHPAPWVKDFYVAARIDAIVYDKALGKTFVLEHKTFEKFYPQFLQLSHQFVIEKYVADGYLKKIKHPSVAGVIYNGLRKRGTPSKSKTTKLFERHVIYVTDKQVEIMLHRVYWKLMETSSKFFPVYPEPSQMTCQFCEFKQPCIEYQRGGDWKFFFDNLYQERIDDEDEWI